MFDRLNPEQKIKAQTLLNEWLKRPKHANTKPGTRMYFHLVGGAATVAINGLPPNYRQRAAYRMWKKKRAKQAVIQLYGDPTKEFPKG